MLWDCPTLQIILIFINTEKKMDGVYTNARKQLLISSVPAILILHLKRFHQVKGQNPLVYSSASLVDKQFFKCHCAYRYLLFIRRTGRTTIWNMLMGFFLLSNTFKSAFRQYPGKPGSCLTCPSCLCVAALYWKHNKECLNQLLSYSWFWFGLIV